MHGRDELAKVMRKHGLGIGSKTAEKAIGTVSHEMNYAHSDDVLAAIGAGKVSAKQVGTKLLKLMAKAGEGAEAGAGSRGVHARQADDGSARTSGGDRAAASRSRGSTTRSSGSRTAVIRCPATTSSAS